MDVLKALLGLSSDCAILWVFTRNCDSKCDILALICNKWLEYILLINLYLIIN